MNEKKMKKVSSGSYVPDEIAFCILSKLPLKFIKRFSCVCKSWSLLFENPNFINMFFSNSHPLSDDECLILNHYLYSHGWNFYFLSGDKFQNKLKLNLPLPFHNPQRAMIQILGSAIHGTLCIYDVGYNRNVILWNPATDKVKVIPPSFGELLPPEANAEFQLHGFGYDHVRDDYKVFQHVDVENNEPFWEIYSLKSDSWRKLDFDMPTRYQYHDFDVYLNGVCHWWGEANDNDDNVDMVMVSFELGNEVYFTTPLPLDDIYDAFDVNLQVLNGSIVVILNHKRTMSFHLSILGELGVKESWVRLFDIGYLSCILHPIRAWKNDIIFFRKKDDQLACFDLTTGVIEEIGVKEEHHSCQIVIYKRNLLPFGVKEN